MEHIFFMTDIQEKSLLTLESKGFNFQSKFHVEDGEVLVLDSNKKGLNINVVQIAPNGECNGLSLDGFLREYKK